MNTYGMNTHDRNANEEKCYRLARIIGEADDAYIEAAQPGTAPAAVSAGNRNRLRFLTRIGATAACVLFAAGMTVFLPRISDRFVGYDSAATEGAAPEETSPKVNVTQSADEGASRDTTLSGSTTTAEETVTVDCETGEFLYTSSRYGSVYTSAETAVLWPWESMTDDERYSSLSVGGVEYRAAGTAINEVYLDTEIGSGTAAGWEPAGEKRHTIDVPVFPVKEISDDLLFAVYFESLDAYYLYKKDEYDPPETLSDCIAAYSMTEYLPLTYWHAQGEEGYFHLTADRREELWELLSACADAPFGDTYHSADRDADCITFSVTSQVYGIKNRVFSVSSDGFVRTNAFDYGFAYDIGTDAAAEILAFIRDNSIPTNSYPETENAVIGTVTAVTQNADGTWQLLLDDSVMMENPADGLVYTVEISDPKLTRYLSSGIVGVGDTVRIAYDRLISMEDLVIDCPEEITQVVITGDEVMIPE